ncbi:hypothetical protein [Pseudomonas poae]|uniref:Uncharacterized protein n=1 Tax=Pseudomonas poae TaxID=200451 RepID=A0A2S9ECJ2_9PSED|nr:hypothetical protein [Pseudomonas poae]PRA23808.1 hypothetical protein CQZ97_25315 [Pseudomonas poae]PRC12703.1 hypothetical protein CQZ99_22485 [Pseudomonas poae]
MGDFDGPGQPSGSRQSGSAPDSIAPDSAGLAEYRAAQQKKWQAQQDAAARDKLFGQPTSGRVDGKDVDPFSSKTLEENAQALVDAENAHKARASVLKRKDIAKVAAITVAITAPLTVVGAVVSGTVNEALKPLINPSELPATAQSVEDGRLVDHIQKNVFLLTNTLADLRLEPHVAPSLKWVAQTNDERMDSLEDMLDYVEPEFAKEALQRGIAFEPASTGEQHDDIKGRAIAVESRMAALTALMGKMTSKLDVTAA